MLYHHFVPNMILKEQSIQQKTNFTTCVGSIEKLCYKCFNVGIFHCILRWVFTLAHASSTIMKSLQTDTLHNWNMKCLLHQFSYPVPGGAIFHLLSSSLSSFSAGSIYIAGFKAQLAPCRSWYMNMHVAQNDTMHVPSVTMPPSWLETTKTAVVCLNI